MTWVHVGLHHGSLSVKQQIFAESAAELFARLETPVWPHRLLGREDHDKYCMGSKFCIQSTHSHTHIIYISDCAPAENDGLKLSVELTDLSQVEQVQHDTLQQHYYTVGCIAFTPNVSLTRFNNSNIKQVYYSYDFGDGVQEVDSTEPNITHCYNETGSYNYSVNAIAVLARLLSLHTNLTSNMELLGKL